MFILLISRGVPSKRDPQWGCFEKDQAEALVAAGHKVVVVSVDSRFRCYWKKFGISNYTINGIHYLDCFVIPGAITRKLLGLKINFWIKQLQIRWLFKRVLSIYGKPDILYSHYLVNSYLALTLKDKYKLPLVAIEHWSQLNKDVLSKEAMWLGQATYHRCDTVISVSNSLKGRIKQHFNVDSTVVHNVIGTEFTNITPSANHEGSRVRFVSTGSLLPMKAYDVLIEAFSRLEIPLDKWKLTIIGEGKEHVSLQKQIDNLRLSNNVQLIGRKNKEEIVKILSDSDVFVLASRSETFGVVYIEAMMMGLPVIASMCGGPEDFVQKSDGLLVPVEDVDALSNAIKEMYENHHKYDRKKIAEDARNRFSPAVIAQQLTSIFDDVILNVHR